MCEGKTAAHVTLAPCSKFVGVEVCLLGDQKLRLPGYANELTRSIKATIKFAEGIPEAQQCVYNYSPKPLAD